MSQCITIAQEMKNIKTWNFPDDRIVASLGAPTSSKVSVGFEEGYLAVLDPNTEETPKEVLIDSKFPIIDHCWTKKEVLCATSGKNIVLYDVEKQKLISTLIGHLDVTKS